MSEPDTDVGLGIDLAPLADGSAEVISVVPNGRAAVAGACSGQIWSSMNGEPAGAVPIKLAAGEWQMAFPLIIELADGSTLTIAEDLPAADDALVDAVWFENAVIQSLKPGEYDAKKIEDGAEQFAPRVTQEECAEAAEDQSEPQEAGIKPPLWLGDRYADADGIRALPRLQLVEERPSSDHRRFFISAERSKLEREMVAKAAREKPRSAVNANYSPYRINMEF
jgi:hypothetical protein